MEELIPIFPLEVVAYPGDGLNLHIFEPRYQQLINDTVKSKKPFGIPTVVDRKIGGLGTLVELTRVANVQADGQMDIQTRGLRIFKIERLQKLYPGKLYSAAVVAYPANDPTGHSPTLRRVLADVKKLHGLLKVEKKLPKPEAKLTSYDLGHHVGLSLAQEYALLGLWTEVERLNYLQRHLEQVLPVVTGMESLKEKIKLNGHFKNLPGFEIQ